MAFIFTGWTYDSTPPLCTIVVATPNEAKLVFIKHLTITDMIQKPYFYMIARDEIIEYLNGVAHGSPNYFRIYKEDNILKITPERKDLGYGDLNGLIFYRPYTHEQIVKTLGKPDTIKSSKDDDNYTISLYYFNNRKD